MASPTNINMQEQLISEGQQQHLDQNAINDEALIGNRLRLKALLMTKYYFFENVVEYNITSIVIGLAKIMICIVIIALANFSGDESSDLSLIWILVMIIYDIYCLILNGMRVITIYDAGGKIYDFQDPVIQFNPYYDLEFQGPESNENISMHFSINGQPEIDDTTFIKIKAKLQKCRRLSIISYFFWIGLFISGLFFSSLVWDSTTLPYGDTFVLAYTIVSIVGILMSIVIYLGSKMVHYQINKMDGIPNPLNYLKTVNYNQEISGNKECAICLLDYSEGDKIALPPCTSLHHLHQECAEDWFKLSSKCPYCRKSICE